MIARVLTCLFGVWLLASPWILGFDDRGAALATASSGWAVLATALIAGCARPLHWLLVAIGAWIIAMPLLLGFREAASVVNSFLVGTAVVAAAILPSGWRYLGHRITSLRRFTVEDEA